MKLQKTVTKIALSVLVCQVRTLQTLSLLQKNAMQHFGISLHNLSEFQLRLIVKKYIFQKMIFQKWDVVKFATDHLTANNGFLQFATNP